MGRGDEEWDERWDERWDDGDGEEWPVERIAGGGVEPYNGDREKGKAKKDRDRDKETERRDKDKDKDKEHRRGRSRDGDRDRRRRSRERRHHSASRSRSRSRDRRRKSRDRTRRHRRSRSRSRSRSRDRKRSKKDTSAVTTLPPVIGAAQLILNAHGAAKGQNTSAALLAAQQAQRSRVWVGNITYEVGEEHIRQAFESMCGPIKKIDMSNDPSTGHHRGYCFIEFFTPEAAQSALVTMSGYNLGGRGIKVGTPNGAPVPPPGSLVNPTLAALMAQQQAGELAKSLGISKPGGIPPTVVHIPKKGSAGVVNMPPLPPMPPPMPPMPPMPPTMPGYPDPAAAQAMAAQMLQTYAHLPAGP
uniref:FUSE-binding protein-interacting repressor n=1 Tax=Euglena gracilis TaxID=3039 RepID=A0AA51UA91_EUGGR|nr:FUSE-binding protein-interacting repressor [Euglena gracilis]BDX17133.1 60 kDa poly(U)-binding-splicing factor B [Euglena gracilis]